jgi:hypothetical protein
MRQTIYYCVIGLGVLTGIVVLVRQFVSRERLDPPNVLAEQILENSPTEQRIRAAHDMVRHGSQARSEMHRVMSDLRTDDPEVMAATIEAAAAARCWQSLPRLFELMEHQDVRVRGKAGAAVGVIMGADYYFRAADPPEERAAKLALIKETYQHMNRRRILEQFYEGAAEGGANPR